jgi:hypothetical protein
MGVQVHDGVRSLIDDSPRGSDPWVGDISDWLETGWRKKQRSLALLASPTGYKPPKVGRY